MFLANFFWFLFDLILLSAAHNIIYWRILFFSALSKVFNAVNEAKSFQIFPSPEAVCNRRTFNIISTSIKLKSAKRLIFVQKILILKVSLFSLMNLEFSIQTYLHLPTCRILYISNVLKRVIGKGNLLSLRN